ncbi:NPCBM/NEW2 domain-containing protein [Kitasatospora sp. NPDC004289]
MRRHPRALSAAIALIAGTIALPALPAATASADTAAGPYVLQVENMSLTNFATETVNHSAYNNPVETVTYARGAAGQTSSARSTFAGAAGTYDLITRYNGKTAGGVSYRLTVNSAQVDSWNANGRWGTDYTDPKNIDTRTSSKVALKPGDVIELTAVGSTDVPRVDRITIQNYVGAPTSPLTINSPNAALNDGFAWGRDRALGMAFYQGNPMMGHEPEWWRLTDATHQTVQPGYWGAYTSRESYYNRDISHQSDGAHVIGLDNETLNMFKTFAGDADDPGQNGWPLWAHSPTGAMYYIDQTGFRELPSPFNLMAKAFKQYQWTGNAAWINDPTLSAYYDSTMNQFLASHQVTWNDANPAAEQPVAKKQNGEYTATFFEFPNENLTSAADALGFQYQSMLAYAQILKAKGDTAGSTTWANRAQRVRNHFESQWFDSANNRYVRGKDANGTGYSSWGHEASFLMMLNGLGDYGPRTSAYLDFIAANDDSLNVEATSYLPEMYYQYNRSGEGWSWLKKLMKDKDTYPEISFLAVSNTVDGMMGVQPDAPNHKVATVSRLTSETPWVEIDHLKVGDSDLKLKHIGTTGSVLTNNAGSTVNWEAQFYGSYSTISVNGTAYPAQTKSLYGQTVSYVSVPVNAGATVTAAAGSTVVDTTAPSTPSGLATANLTDASVDLSWNASTDNVGLTNYQVLRNGSVIGTTTGTTFTANGLAGSTGYTFTVKAVDTTGNVSAASNAAAVTTLPTPKTVNLSDLAWASYQNSFGTPRKDTSIDGTPIKLQGTVYPKGIGTHANSTITYNLGGGYTRFQADTGVDDEITATGSVRFEVWGDGVKLYESPYTLGPNNQTQSVNVDVTGVNTLVLKALDGGDGINSDHADWAGAKLTVKASAPVNASDLAWASAQADFGTVQKDRSIDGNPLKINGTTYPKGIGTHANSTITYNLNRGYTRFQADTGVDDEVSSYATLKFEVWGDGVKLYESPSVNTPTTPAQPVDVNVAGVNTLTLKVTDGGDGINSDHADWAGAKFLQ